MLNEKEYVISEPVFETKKMFFTEDIPLCSLKRLFKALKKKLKQALFKMWLFLRFGYSIYNDPNIEERGTGFGA